MAPFTFDDLLHLLRSVGKNDLANLFERLRAHAEPQLAPLLPKIGERAAEKGFWTPPDANFSPEDLAALPYLREIAGVLRREGSDAAMEKWRQLVGAPGSSEALAAVALPA